MNGRYILDKYGRAKHCDNLVTWGKFIEEGRSKYHLDDEIKGQRLSTVFLGLDHSFGIGGKPLLWETMLFTGNALHDEQWRHHTLGEAYKFHKKKVKELKK